VGTLSEKETSPIILSHYFFMFKSYTPEVISCQG